MVNKNHQIVQMQARALNKPLEMGLLEMARLRFMYNNAIQLDGQRLMRRKDK